MEKHFRSLLVVTGVVALVVAGVLAERNLDLTLAGYNVSQVPSRHRIRLGLDYLRVRKLFAPRASSKFVVATAWALARQRSSEFSEEMEEGAQALSLLLPLARSLDGDPFQPDAAYEALVLLNRMPTDAELLRISEEMATVLSKGAGSTEIEPAELFAVNEALSMHAAKKTGIHGAYERLYDIPGVNQQWRNDLATVRIALAACMQHKSGKVPSAVGEALDRGFGKTWLDFESRNGWDIALVHGIQASESSQECKAFALRYGAFIELARIPGVS